MKKNIYLFVVVLLFFSATPVFSSQYFIPSDVYIGMKMENVVGIFKNSEIDQVDELFVITVVENKIETGKIYFDEDERIVKITAKYKKEFFLYQFKVIEPMTIERCFSFRDRVEDFVDTIYGVKKSSVSYNGSGELIDIENLELKCLEEIVFAMTLRNGEYITEIQKI
jgi:hypothetical protein